MTGRCLSWRGDARPIKCGVHRLLHMSAVIERTRILRNFAGTRIALVATLICCLSCALFLSRPAHALDPEVRLTQYMHTSWRIQDGSVSAGMFSFVQALDGFLWLTSFSQCIYLF